MRRFLLGLLIVLSVATWAGCGSRANDQHSMVVLRRNNDDSAAPSQKQPAKKPAAAPANDAPAAAEPVAAAPVAANQQPGPRTRRPTKSTKPVLEAGEVPVEVTPPETPLTLAEQRKQSVDNLERIGVAIDAYVAQNGSYPPPAIFDSAGNPLLSWRVALLPYLGYESLYQKFRLDEPWDSRHNRMLLPAIPKVYASPRRFDEKTNYCVPVGSSTLFQGERGVAPRKVDDGEKNTVMVLETNDPLAVSWTEPADYDYDAQSPTRGLGNNYPDGFLVVWGGGRVSRLPREIPLRTAQAMYSIAGGESFTSQTVHNSPLKMESAAEVAAGPTTDAAQPTAAVAVGASPVAAGTVSPARPAAVSASGEAATFAQAAQASFHAGRENDALNYLYASGLCSDGAAAATPTFRWCPALRRPTPAVRFGVGVKYVGPRDVDLKKLTVVPPAGRDELSEFSDQAQTVAAIGGELGQVVLTSIADHIRQGRSGELLQRLCDPEHMPDRRRATEAQEGRRAAWLFPGMVVLGEGSRRELLQLAQQDGIDVLVLLEVKIDPVRDGSYNHTCQARLIDAVTGADLYRTPIVNHRKVLIARGDRLQNDPMIATRDAIDDFLQEELAVAEIPAALNARHVAQRVETLVSEQHDNPLPVLAEIKMYASRGLLRYDQLASSFREAAGAAAGDVLAGGDPGRRAEVVKRWLPRNLPELADATPTRTRRRGPRSDE